MKILVDGNNVCHIVNHSMGQLSNDERRTGVVFGFMKQMLMLSKRMKTKDFIFCWDSQKSFRKEIYPEYKSNRKNKEKTEQEEFERQTLYDQISEIRSKILPSLGFKNNFIKTGYEADDLIAYTALTNPEEDFTVISTDQDLYQILNNHIRIYNTITKKFITKQDFIEKFQLDPTMFREIKAIAGCFDKETEILTNKGWKYFFDLQSNDQVYSLNTQTDIASYEKIKKIISYKHKGEMFQIKGRHCDLLVTPNHKFFGCQTTMGYKKTKKPIVFKEIKDLINIPFFIPLVSNWIGNDAEYFTIPEYSNTFSTSCKKRGNFVSTRSNKKLQIKMEDWVAFLGIWLSEGYTAKDKNKIKYGIVGVSQTKKLNKDKIKLLLNKLPFKWSYSNSAFMTQSVQLGNYLHKLGTQYERYIPQEIKELSPKYLNILLQWLILGDGTITKNNGYERKFYYTVNEKLAGDIQEIAIKCDINVSIRIRKPREWFIKGNQGWSKQQYELNFKKSKAFDLINQTITKIDFNDFVYDVETEPNHTIFVRRNGKAVWSSNCTSDYIKGIQGVGEITAAKYLREEKISSTLIDRIHEGCTVIERNRKLTYLPFQKEYNGTLPNMGITLKKDDLKLYNFRKLFNELSFNSFLSDMSEWERSFGL